MAVGGDVVTDQPQTLADLRAALDAYDASLRADRAQAADDLANVLDHYLTEHGA